MFIVSRSHIQGNSHFLRLRAIACGGIDTDSLVPVVGAAFVATPLWEGSPDPELDTDVCLSHKRYSLSELV